LPKGRIVEIYGPESSGKSTLALTVVAKAQQEGLLCAYIDMEHALDPVYMAALGVDLDELLLAQPDYGEQALDIADSLLKTGKLGVLVVDSVAALTPKAELEGDMEQAHMGLQARMMAKHIRKITALAAQHKTLVIFINQLREKIGIMFGNPETTPGGRALKFAASVRIDLRKKEDIKNVKTGEITGIVVKAKIVKNKMAPPMKVCEYDIIYGEGIDEYAAMLEIGVDKKLFTKAGPWYKYNDQPFAQGKQAARDRIKDTPELWEHIKMVAKT
jgi:recombination protein RecA